MRMIENLHCSWWSESCCSGLVYCSKRNLNHLKDAWKRAKVDIVAADIVRSLCSDSRDDAIDDNCDKYDDSDDDEEDIVEQQIRSDDDIEDDKEEEHNED